MREYIRLEALEEELTKGQVAHGSKADAWTLRIKTLIGPGFRKSVTLSAIAQMLRRHGLSIRSRPSGHWNATGRRVTNT
ncbi:hypothetical protein ACWGBO_14835 [[Kitasatospora] papulosa]